MKLASKSSISLSIGVTVTCFGVSQSLPTVVKLTLAGDTVALLVFSEDIGILTLSVGRLRNVILKVSSAPFSSIVKTSGLTSNPQVSSSWLVTETLDISNSEYSGSVLVLVVVTITYAISPSSKSSFCPVIVTN